MQNIEPRIFGSECSKNYFGVGMGAELRNLCWWIQPRVEFVLVILKSSLIVNRERPGFVGNFIKNLSWLVRFSSHKISALMSNWQFGFIIPYHHFSALIANLQSGLIIPPKKCLKMVSALKFSTLMTDPSFWLGTFFVEMALLFSAKSPFYTSPKLLWTPLILDSRMSPIPFLFRYRKKIGNRRRKRNAGTKENSGIRRQCWLKI